MMTISIAGCGWFGLGLARALLKDGNRVKGSTTTEAKIDLLSVEGVEPFLIRLSKEEEQLKDVSFFSCDVLLIAIPPKVHLQGGDFYLFTQKRLSELAIKHRISKIIFISSTSVYGEIGALVNEDTPTAPDTLSGEVLVQAEKLFTSNAAFQTTVIRFGGMVGPGRDPGRFFAGKENIANGLAPINLIHLDDCIGIAKAIIQKNFFGYTINGCAPYHPTRKDFYTKASQKAGLKEPHFVDELINWKVVTSKFIPGQLYDAFKVNEWMS